MYLINLRYGKYFIHNFVNAKYTFPRTPLTQRSNEHREHFSEDNLVSIFRCGVRDLSCRKKCIIIQALALFYMNFNTLKLNYIINYIYRK